MLDLVAVLIILGLLAVAAALIHLANDRHAEPPAALRPGQGRPR